MAKGDRVVILEDGPYDGMLDAVSPSARHEGKYKLGQNVYPLDPSVGEGLVGRPGTTQLAAPIGTGVVQGLVQFRRSLFSDETKAVRGGKLSQYNWGLNTWTEVPTTGTLSGASITLDTNATVAMVPLRGSLLISDGINTPFLDGPSLGAVTKLTNAPAFSGKPVYYLGRIFGIKASDPRTLVWSETDDYNTGYEAGGFNNAWTVTQSNADPLTALHADNEGLTLFRARSATRVYGDDPSQFTTGNTVDLLDQTHGTVAPFGMVPVGLNVLVLDADLKPHLCRPSGSGFTPVWQPLEATIGEVLTSYPQAASLLASRILGANYTPAGLALIMIPPYAPLGVVSKMWAFDVSRGAPVPVGVWTFPNLNITAMAIVTNGTATRQGDPYLMIGHASGLRLLANPRDQIYSDAGASIAHAVETQALGYSTNQNKVFDRLDLTGHAPTTQTWSVTVTAPDRSTAPQTVVVPTATDDVKVEVGLESDGRWARVRIDHAVVGEQFGLTAMTLSAVVGQKEPKAL